MKQLKELTSMTAVCLLLYYLYWSVVDDSFIASLFANYEFFFMRTGIDVSVCLALTYLSTIYSRGMMRIMNVYAPLQRVAVIPILVLFILDLITAWGMSELWQRIYSESNFFDYFQNIFVFGLLAALISSVKINSLFWQKKIEMERERNVLENKVAEAERIINKARIHNLQSQVNPHFFFNNLSALSSLISTDTKSAKEFVSAFAQMYRHILKGMEQELVPLKEELQLVREYAKLLRIRHGECVQINMPGDILLSAHAFVPPVSIQHLVENAVKHNAMTAASPLIINISVDNDRVSVCNNRSLLSGVETYSGTGLDNLRKQLRLFGADDFEKHEDSDIFCISFPLILQE